MYIYIYIRFLYIYSSEIYYKIQLKQTWKKIPIFLYFRVGGHILA